MQVHYWLVNYTGSYWPGTFDNMRVNALQAIKTYGSQSKVHISKNNKCKPYRICPFHLLYHGSILEQPLSNLDPDWNG